MIEISTLKEAKEYLEGKVVIQFQDKIFYNIKQFENFINDISSATKFEMPKESKRCIFYCNFGTIYANALYITEDRLIFFNNGTLVCISQRTDTNDIEMTYTINNCTSSKYIIEYNADEEEQYINF